MILFYEFFLAISTTLIWIALLQEFSLLNWLPLNPLSFKVKDEALNCELHIISFISPFALMHP